MTEPWRTSQIQPQAKFSLTENCQLEPNYIYIAGNMTALDEARATIARIEEMRARTDATLATAALNISTALTSMAENLRVVDKNRNKILSGS